MVRGAFASQHFLIFNFLKINAFVPLPWRWPQPARFQTVIRSHQVLSRPEHGILHPAQFHPSCGISRLTDLLFQAVCTIQKSLRLPSVMFCSCRIAVLFPIRGLFSQSPPAL